MTISERHRGWLGFGGAKMKDDAKPDLKESFIWGYEYQDGEIDDHPIRVRINGRALSQASRKMPLIILI